MKIYSIDIHRLGLKCDTRTTPVRTSVLDQCCPGLGFKENFKSWFLPTYLQPSFGTQKKPTGPITTKGAFTPNVK
jgi:hypothetical protein